MLDKRDLNTLWNNYLSVHTAGSFSATAMNEYGQYNDIKSLSTRSAYLAAKTNQKIYIDMRASRGITAAPDFPIPNNRPMLTLDFKDGETSKRNYRVTVR